MRDADHLHRFAAEWVAAWNSHELDRIAALYAPEVVYHSPIVAQLVGSTDGLLSGEAVLRGYVRAALCRYPELRFHLRQVYAGAGSVVIEYESSSGLVAAEVFVLDDTGRACEVFCHYRPRQERPLVPGHDRAEPLGHRG
jgi:hypothetical protein